MTKARRVILGALLGVLVLGMASCGDDAPPAAAWPDLSPEQHAEAERLGVPVKFENEFGMRFVLIPAGTFRMGSPEDEEGRDDDETPHQVRITKSFYMQMTEVTCEIARRIDLPRAAGGTPIPGDDHDPVFLQWVGAQEVARLLSAKDPLRTYRLPTEAEWEYACRAGTTTRYSWGDSMSEMHRYANTLDRSMAAEAKRDPTTLAEDDGHQGRAPVGSYLPNRWGLFDMHGNVNEWCADWYGEYPRGEAVDPRGPSREDASEVDIFGKAFRPVDPRNMGQGRVTRGGGSSSRPPSLRAAYRRYAGPFTISEESGFRLVSPLPDESK